MVAASVELNSGVDGGVGVAAGGGPRASGGGGVAHGWGGGCGVAYAEGIAQRRSAGG